MGISTINPKGRSRRVYTLQIYQYGTGFNTRGCRVRSHEQGTADYVAYIALRQANWKLSYRFDNHHRATEFERKNATHACVLRVDNKKQRIAVERDLMDYYSPPCNRT